MNKRSCGVCFGGVWVWCGWLGLLMIGGCAAEKPVDGAGASGPITQRISQAYGADQWAQIRYIRFDMVVRIDGHETARFSYLWDRSTGDYRYETDTATFTAAPFLDETTGQWHPIEMDLPAGSLLGLINREAGRGHVYINGEEVTGQNNLRKYILQRIDNDIFMLTLPLELARSNPTGKTMMIYRKDGTPAEVYRYSYPPGVGTTPKDLWALFYNPETLMIYKVKVKPQHTRKIISADWNRHSTIAGAVFSLERVIGNKRISFEKMTIPKTVPEGIFTDPSVRMPW